MIGNVLGKYRIEAELSRGGMGAVYRARHEVLERPVAIKLLRPELTGSPDLLTRFVNEARAASAIRHPSIIEVIDFGQTDDGQAYLVMELLEGESLATRLQSRGRLAEGEAVRITCGIASALSAAHAKGIIHRDLKPDNVFLIADPDLGERAKVLDFGIAKLADMASQAQTQTGALMGTPLYMAPEQARSAASIDHRADLYSLGCILYELLTGKPPLVAEGTGEIIALHMFTQPDPPSTLVPGITPALESIVMRLLDKEPAARFGSAADLSDALASAYGTTSVRPATPPVPTSSQPAVAAAPSIMAPPRRPHASRLPLVAAGVTLAVGGIVAIVIALSGDDHPAAAVEAPPNERVPVVQPVVQRPEIPAPAPAPAPPKSEVVSPPVPVPAPVSRPAVKGKPVRRTDKGTPIEPTI